MARKVLTKNKLGDVQVQKDATTKEIYPILKDDAGRTFVGPYSTDKVQVDKPTSQKYQPDVVNRRDKKERENFPDNYRIVGVGKEKNGGLFLYLKNRYDVYNKSQIENGWAMDNNKQNRQFDQNKQYYDHVAYASYDDMMKLIGHGNFSSDFQKDFDWNNERAASEIDLRYSDSEIDRVFQKEGQDSYKNNFVKWYRDPNQTNLFYDSDVHGNTKPFCVRMQIDEMDEVVSDSVEMCYTAYNEQADVNHEKLAYQHMIKEQQMSHTDEIVYRGLSDDYKRLDNYVISDIKELRNGKYAVQVESRYDIYDLPDITVGKAGTGKNARPFLHVERDERGNTKVSDYQIFTDSQLDKIMRLNGTSLQKLHRDGTGAFVFDDAVQGKKCPVFRASLLRGRNGLTVDMNSVQPSSIPYCDVWQQSRKQYTKDCMEIPQASMQYRDLEFGDLASKQLSEEESPEFA